MARAGGRAGTWDGGPRESAWQVRLPDAARGAGAQIRAWVAAEVAPGRLMPWLPIAFGAGVIVYFTAEHEPWLAAPLVLLATLTVAAILARGHTFAFPILLGTAAIVAGFATATLKSAIVAHPILRHGVWNVAITGSHAHTSIGAAGHRSSRRR